MRCYNCDAPAHPDTFFSFRFVPGKRAKLRQVFSRWRPMVIGGVPLCDECVQRIKRTRGFIGVEHRHRAGVRYEVVGFSAGVAIIGLVLLLALVFQGELARDYWPLALMFGAAFCLGVVLIVRTMRLHANMPAAEHAPAKKAKRASRA